MYMPILVWILCIAFSQHRSPDHFSKKKKQLDFRDVYGKYCAVLQESKCARMA